MKLKTKIRRNRQQKGSGGPDNNQTFDFMGQLGSGNFGKVEKMATKCTKDYYGAVKVKKSEVDYDATGEKCNSENESDYVVVAVKSLLSGGNEGELLRENTILKTLNESESDSDGKNVILKHYKYRNDPASIVTEYCNGGDLRHWLLSLHKFSDEDKISAVNNFKNISINIAEGLQFMHEHNIIHRDIAARNILLNISTDLKSIMPKIADFGLSVQLNDEEISYQMQGGLYPIRWMSPETLNHGIFTKKSDMWSYAITLYEIYTYGSLPYSSMDHSALTDAILAGYKLMPKEPDNVVKNVLEIIYDAHIASGTDLTWQNILEGWKGQQLHESRVEEKINNGPLESVPDIEPVQDPVVRMPENVKEGAILTPSEYQHQFIYDVHRPSGVKAYRNIYKLNEKNNGRREFYSQVATEKKNDRPEFYSQVATEKKNGPPEFYSQVATEKKNGLPIPTAPEQSDIYSIFSNMDTGVMIECVVQDPTDSNSVNIFNIIEPLFISRDLIIEAVKDSRQQKAETKHIQRIRELAKKENIKPQKFKITDKVVQKTEFSRWDHYQRMEDGREQRGGPTWWPTPEPVDLTTEQRRAAIKRSLNSSKKAAERLRSGIGTYKQTYKYVNRGGGSKRKDKKKSRRSTFKKNSKKKTKRIRKKIYSPGWKIFKPHLILHKRKFNVKKQKKRTHKLN